MATRLIPPGLLLLLLFALLPSGCRGRRGRVEPPVADLTGAEDAYLLGRYDRAYAIYRAFRERHGRAPAAREAAYWEGQCLLEMDRPREAYERFADAARSADPGLVARARAGQARARTAEKRYREAEAIYTDLRRGYPAYIDEGEILAALAACRAGRGDRAGADDYRQELRRRYGSSPFAARAGETTAPADGGSGQNLYTVQAGAFQSSARARRLQTDLRRRGIDSILVPRREGGMTLYAVQAGVFSTPDRAERLARQIHDAGFEAVVR